MLLTVVLFYHIRSMEQDKAKVAFDRAARERFDELQSDLQLSILRVNALGAFCESNYPVTRASFDSFGGSLINDTVARRGVGASGTVSREGGPGRSDRPLPRPQSEAGAQDREA